MQIDGFDWFKFSYLNSLYLIIILTRFVLIVDLDTAKPVTSIDDHQLCSKIQSRLSFGKYQTYQISSNITYVSRVYAQSFLAYSSLDDILLFIEPKHQIYVYNAQSVHLIVNLTTTNIVYATSCISLTTDDRHDLFFVYESRLISSHVSIRVCEIRFDIFKLNFEDKKCVNTLIIRCDKPDIRVNGLTIKRDHAGTNKSLLFMSTDIGLIYTIFDTLTGSLIREPIILNDTLNEGSIVVTSSGIIYYANKQEHTIHEIHITRDFRIRYGKIIKSNAIRSPFGLITDECNHLYIATKSMILIMFLEKYTTIRSVFSKASDLSITLERLNSTTYIYATVKISSGRIPSTWMFNFLSFNDSEKSVVTTRSPVIKIEKNLVTGTNNIKMYTQILSTEKTILNTQSLSSDDNRRFDHSPQLTEIHLTTQSSSDYNTFSKYVISTTNPLETIESNAQRLTSVTLSTDVFDGYSQFSTSTSLFSPTTQSTTDYDDTYLEDKNSQETYEEKSTFLPPLSSEHSTEYLHSSVSTSTSLKTTVDSTLSSSDPFSIKKLSIVTEAYSVPHSDQSFSNLHKTERTKLLSTIFNEYTTRSSNINNEHTTVQSLLTAVDNISSDTTLRTTSEYLSDINIPHFSTSSDQSASQINDMITSTIPLQTTSLQNQFPDPSINSIQTSTFSPVVTDFIDKEIEDGINQKFSSSMLVEVTVTATLHQSSPSIVSSTVLIPSHSFQLSSSLNPSLAHSSTTSTNLNRLLSKHFSEAITTISNPPTMLSSSINTLQTTDSAVTSDITEQSSSTIFSTEFSSSLITSHPKYTSSSVYATSSGSSTILDSTSTIQTDEPSTILLRTTDNEQNLGTTDYLPFETTPEPSTIDEHSDEYTSIQSSLEITSTISPDIYHFKTEHSTPIVTRSKPQSKRPTRRRTSESTTSTTTSSTTTTIDLNGTRKQKSIRWRSSTTTATTTLVQTTSIYSQFLTSSPITIWQSKLNSTQPQQIVVIKPTSNTLLSNDLLNTLFNSTTNSSNEKFIYFNLIDLPPSSWNLSLHTNDSVLLDILLPSPSYSYNLDTTTNLTITNVEANRFATNIVGSPINLQVDQIQAKQFSLSMNLTSNQTNSSISDVVIGRIKSEQFELNITKSDDMNIHVQQVDSETAELSFNSEFCTSESNLQINLNISKNATIRYGDRPPLRIGPVFTRVHMLKQSCDLDQPFALFFDICQGQNPCLNGGTCKSNIPDYDNPSYSHQESSQIDYQCICSVHISGEHCQYLQYPFGYCINGGSLIITYDLNNKTIEKCLCALGFQGIHCEDNINDCINITCSNHGACQDGINTYSCSCFDGFYGNQCEQTTVETVLFQVASKSFATVAILLIAGIAGLVVASDIHTYVTKKKQKASRKLNKLPRATSELFENSVLLLGFGEAPIELSDLSSVNRERKPITTTVKKRPRNIRRKPGYQHNSKRRYTRTLEKPISKRSLLSNPSYETIL